MSKIEVQEDTNCWAVVPAESHGVVAVACSEEAATAYLVSHFADVSELSHEEAKKRVDAGDHDYIVTRCAVRVVFWNDCEKIGDAVERHHLDLRDYSGEADLRAELARVTAERDALLRWKQWTVAREMVAIGRRATVSEELDAEEWHRVMQRYGVRFRIARMRAGVLFSDVQTALGIAPAVLSGVELGREPPFDDATTRRLCELTRTDPQQLIEASAEAMRVVMELTGEVKP